DVLGLREIAKPRTFDFSVLWFQLGNQQLHLLVRPHPDAVSPRHFALRVADARAARAHFKRHGVATEEPTPIPHCDRFSVADPDPPLRPLLRGRPRPHPRRGHPVAGAVRPRQERRPPAGLAPHFARRRYFPSAVSTTIFSPISTNEGTVSFSPVSSVAGLYC